jgi:hypothetical protein
MFPNFGKFQNKRRFLPSLTGNLLETRRHRSGASGISRAFSWVAGSALLLGALMAVPRAASQALPPPPVAILQDSGSLADGFIFVGPTATGVANPSQGPEIVDSLGRPVWFSPITNGQVPADFRVQTYQGNPVLTWSQSAAFGVTNGPGTVDYILDSTYGIVATVKGGNGFNADMHEFQITPQDTALIVVYNTMQADLSSVGGPVNGMVTEGVVQEIDIATGAVLLEWHSLPNVALTESYVPAPASGPYDYFHINAAKLDTDGNILVSSRHTWTVYKINRTSGAIMWRLGGKKSDFTLGPGLPFAWQHDVEAVDAKTLRIFDNESNGVPVLPYSRVIWVSHDDTAMTANIVETIVHPAKLSVLAEGSAQALDNGDTFVDWGILGRVSEFNGAGQLVFDAVEPSGYSSYRGYRFPWVGAPATSPTASAVLNSDGTMGVHADWNGATQVASWEVLGGASSGALALLATTPWNGLDTVIPVSAPVTAIQVVALDASGSTIGTSAAVAGPFPAAFPTQPVSQVIAAGATVSFTVAASGSGSSYQWMLNGSPVANGTTISGATGPTLVITGATAADAGTYTAVASSFGNSITSDPATLTVSATADPGRLVDASVRAVVGKGDGGLIIGFVTGGQGASGTMPVLVRASGPALAQLGVGGVLPDPDLQLYNADGVLASNSGWAGDPALAATAASVRAFAWSSPSSLDSALDEALPAGPYSAVITGASGDTGVALAEVYDATPAGTRIPTEPRIINISGRAQVGTGDQVLTAGFVIGGGTSKTVLIRGSGPALVPLGVTGTLADPLLQLYRSNGDGTSTLLESNTGWGGNPQIAATAASVGSFSWGSAATPDAALLLTLPPGAYTAQISGASGDTGIALVEVYEVP